LNILAKKSAFSTEFLPRSRGVEIITALSNIFLQEPLPLLEDRKVSPFYWMFSFWAKYLRKLQAFNRSISFGHIGSQRR
jgi:hypothetical protein